MVVSKDIKGSNLNMQTFVQRKMFNHLTANNCMVEIISYSCTIQFGLSFIGFPAMCNRFQLSGMSS